VFDGVAPSSDACLTHADEERMMWDLAGLPKVYAFRWCSSQLSKGSSRIGKGFM
jgi:hypothetical protein